jgi:hypothetical protein
MGVAPPRLGAAPRTGFWSHGNGVACERLGETKVATLESRDRPLVRPRHRAGSTLLLQ